MRRFAAHEIVDGDCIYRLGVVETDDGIVSDIYPLDGEQPFTEWVGGTLTIIEENGKRKLKNNTI
ncbi:hypothetical protein HPS56_07585 [Prevotella sp. PMUR]|uniref:Uncharacterized protein n=1 Tax=Xylanibacter muris TaxID=2736290 RepID=A0ABX2ANS4_9BACT|nr:hypothetical protein [Xylanibacter muris]